MEINISELSQEPPQQICQYLSSVSNHRIKIIVSYLVRQYQLSSSCCVFVELMRFFLLQEEAPVHAHVKRLLPGLIPKIAKSWPISWSSYGHFKYYNSELVSHPLSFSSVHTHSHSGSSLSVPNFPIFT